MPHPISFYELSPAADQDLSDVFDYSEAEFGLDQAVVYLKNLDHCFTRLVDNPAIGLERAEIHQGVYSIASGSHRVFYRILEDRIRIVRVLHGSRDMPRHFKDQE